MTEKIVSKPTNKKYRDGWDKAFGNKYFICHSCGHKFYKPMLLEMPNRIMAGIVSYQTGYYSGCPHCHSSKIEYFEGTESGKEKKLCESGE